MPAPKSHRGGTGGGRGWDYGERPQPDSTSPARHCDLCDIYQAFNAAEWKPAHALTPPQVPEQFRHLWTRERVRDLLEPAFMLAMMRLDQQTGRRLMKDEFIPALEQAGYALERVESRP